jgi:heme/copper-type cytochrome/quinol oxidase subunit 3
MDKNRIGMLAFIGSEATFFILLIIAFIYFRWSAPSAGGGANAANTGSALLDPLTTGIYSLFLFASSGTVWLAGRSLKRGRVVAATLWLAATVVLGVIFLIGQGREWARLIAGGTLPSTDEFGTTFFTLTGFHGLHVMVGLLMLLILAGFGLARMLNPARRGPAANSLETISLYWHFVDVVWIVIFAIVYLTIPLGVA